VSFWTEGAGVEPASAVRDAVIYKITGLSDAQPLRSASMVVNGHDFYVCLPAFFSEPNAHG
jgi:hypothetical protein